MQGQAFSQRLKGPLAALGAASESERLRLALTGADIAVFDWDVADDTIQWDCADSVLKTHLEAQHLRSGQGLRNWIGANARERLSAYMQDVWPASPTIVIEFESLSLAARDWFEIRAVRITGPDGTAERISGVIRIITEQKNTLARLSYLASCDELTGHLNRTRLREELTRAIARASQESRNCAFVVAAIDKLAVINETYGFDVADEVIVATGQRLAHSLRGSDCIGRTAGNKFGIILSSCGEREMAAVAERLHAAVHGEVIETQSGAVAASVSIGAVWLPEGAATSQEAMLHAEEALETAKHMGRNGFAVYARSGVRESERRRLISIGDEINAAVEEHRLILAYQPIIGAISRKAEHYECLLRMAKKDGSIVAAGQFIPAAETLGLVRLVDRRALEMAVAQLYAHENIKLSINVSGTTAGDQSWLQSFINYVRENREVAERMTVELTETAALQAFEENARFITRLRDMGCRVAIDDFGAGYTSFRNLRNLRVDLVKIDGVYVQNLSQSTDNQLFVRTLVGLAKNFQLETVAEWVSSEEDAQLLASYGVDYFQGFYFGEPDVSPAWTNEDLKEDAAE